MVEQSREAQAPFAHRIAVPFVVRQLPFGAIETRFVVLTTCSSIVMLVLLAVARAARGSAAERSVGVFVVATPGLAYLWENPFLTDAPWLLAQQTALTLVTFDWLLAAALVVIGGGLFVRTPLRSPRYC